MALAQRQIQFAPARADGSGAPSITAGYYLIEPTSEYYNSGTGGVKKIPLMVSIDSGGAPQTRDLDVTPVDFSWAWQVTGHFKGQAKDTIDFIQVPAGTYATVLHFENKTEVPRVDGSTLGPVASATPALELRIQALEATPPGSAAGVSSFHGRTGAVVPLVADPSDITATGILLAKAADAAAVRTIAGAAPISHTHAVPTDLVATGTPSSTTFLRGDGAWAAVSATADLTGVPWYLGTTAGSYPPRPATTRPVIFTDPNVMPANTGSTSGGGGMVPTGSLPGGLSDMWVS